MNRNAGCGAWACKTLAAECPLVSHELTPTFTQDRCFRMIPEIGSLVTLDNWEIPRHSNPGKSSICNESFNAINAHTEMKQIDIHSKFSTQTIGKMTGLFSVLFVK